MCRAWLYMYYQVLQGRHCCITFVFNETAKLFYFSSFGEIAGINFDLSPRRVLPKSQHARLAARVPYVVFTRAGKRHAAAVLDVTSYIMIIACLQ